MTRLASLLAAAALAAAAFAQQDPAPTPAKGVKAESDWAKKTTAVSGDVADLRADAKFLTADRRPLPQAVTVARTPTGLTASGPTADLHALLVPGTRSLVLAVENGPAVRLDLPTPDIGRIDRAKDDDKEKDPALLLTVPVRGAVPGTTLRVAARPTAEAPPGRAAVLTHGGSAPITLADPTPAGDPPVYRVRLPVRDDQAEPLVLIFQAQNPDGSLSRAVEITLTGNLPRQTLTPAKDARPAAVAERTEVPACVLQTAAKAAELCKEAGLVPAFYDPRTGAEVPADEVKDGTVAAQGVDAGTRVFKGEAVLLAFRGPPSLDLPVAYTLAPGIEVDAAFGLVPVRRGGLLGLKAADAQPRRAAASDKDDDPNEDPRVQLTADPGVSLDPARKPDDDGFAAALEQVVGGARANGADNPLAAAVRAAVDGSEGAVRDKVLTAKPADELPADKILDAVTEKLGVKLSDADRSAALLAWKADAGKLPLYALDANRDGKISDDIAVRLIRLLWEQGKYDPATHFQVVPGKGGNVAVLPPKPVDPKWRKTAPVITVENGEGKPVRIPKGPAAVTGGSTPSLVRVPAVAPDELIQEYAAKLRAVGLKFLTDKNQKGVLTTDPVASVNPGEKKWVPSGSGVTVTVTKRVPKLVGLTFKQAGKAADPLKLQPSIAKLPPADDDEVSEQMPEAGQPTPPNGVVYVRCKRKVPDVVGKPASDAVDKLKANWFDPDVIDRLGLHDTIVAQRPEGGESAALHASVVLLVKRPMPKVEGLSYPDAVLKLREYGWRVKNPEQFKNLPAPFVLKQDIGEGKVARLMPDSDTTELARTLTPGVKVPKELFGRTPADAVELLRAAGLKAKFDKPETAFWRVDKTDPPEGDLVAVGTEVTLTLKNTGKKVPKLIGVPTATADATLEGMGVRRKFTDAPKENEVVYKQSVKPETDIDPAEVVALTPGYLVPDLSGMTLADARKAVEARQGTLPEKGVKERVVETDVAADDDKTEVEGQSPKPGLDPVERGTAVGVSVVRSKYKDPRREVPRFKDLTEAEADTLAGDQYDLEKTSESETTTDAKKVGTTRVVSQSPEPGAKVFPTERRVAVTVVTYAAAPVPAKLKVPDYEKVRPFASNKTLEGLEPRLGVVVSLSDEALVTSDPALKGKMKVTFQNPAAGTEADEGGTVNVTVMEFFYQDESKPKPPDKPKPPPDKPQQRFVPNVKGMNPRDAAAELEKHGFTHRAGDPLKDREQNPGEQASPRIPVAEYTKPGIGQPADAKAEVTVYYNKILAPKPPKPPVETDLTCYGLGWKVPVDKAGTTLGYVGRCDTADGRKKITVTLSYTESEQKGGVSRIVVRSKAVDGKLTGKTDETLTYTLDNGVELMIPADGDGVGRWRKAGGQWSAVGEKSGPKDTPRDAKFSLTPPQTK